MNRLQPPALVAITGVSGALGGVLARRLLADGFRVRALFRVRDDAWDSLPHAETVIGNLSDEQALARLTEGAAGVMHIAAMYRNDGPAEAFLEVNLHGTERLLRAAQKAGAERFVYCSTIGVHGSVELTPSDENAPLDPRDNYQESKMRAEAFCRAEVGRTATEIVIIRPCGIYGPGDTRMLKLFRMLAKGVFVQIGAGRSNFHPVYLDDLADGFVRAMTTPGIDGETFIIGGPNYMPLRAYIGTAAAALGVPPPRIKVPYAAVNVAARLCEALCNRIGVEPPLHRRRLTFFKHNRAFSIDHARELLGYDPQTDLAEGFRRTVEWYREQGLLR
ncbi:NAD-dependent epimerase/dehydratase family protein [Sphingomonas aerophila]|uniref:Nucleoside-diphosphate-sugar epimerase n=1 Tax=Sphingomonas aerophila TaxID=1344948 RepID=A0A7W9BGN3_9SPHN|nr:NAD-dependent epimerase/dehydratase family protein [Sphingomonas aerophila]MBB5716866.1 nucleoside-diphosphate-sugar epimerase [Sphingomonas aerophila]